MRARRLLIDNGTIYLNRVLGARVAQNSMVNRLIRACGSRTNGKAESTIRMLLLECA